MINKICVESMCDLTHHLAHASFFAVTRTTDLAPEYRVAVEPTGSTWPMIAGGIVVLSTVAIGLVLRTNRKGTVILPVDDLTHEIYRAYGIGIQHRHSLENVAKLAGMKHLSELFLSEEIFDAAVAKASQVKKLGKRQRGILFEVRYCVFS